MLNGGRWNLRNLTCSIWVGKNGIWSSTVGVECCKSELVPRVFSVFAFHVIFYRNWNDPRFTKFWPVIEECQTEIGWTGRYTRSSILGPEKCLKEFNITCWIFFVQFWSSAHSNNLKVNQNCNLTRDKSAVLVQFQKFRICSFGAVSKHDSGSWYRTFKCLFGQKTGLPTPYIT